MASSMALDPNYPPQFAYVYNIVISRSVQQVMTRIHTKGPSSSIATIKELYQTVIICPNDPNAGKLQVFRYQETGISEEHPHGFVPKSIGSVNLRMKLKTVITEDFDLVSIDDNKQILVQKFNFKDLSITNTEGVEETISIIISEIKFSHRFDSFTAAEKLVGTEIFDHTTIVLACSKSRRCVLKDSKAPSKAEKVIFTGETISSVFYFQNTAFFGIVDSEKSTISFFDMTDIHPDARLISRSVLEANPLSFDQIISCQPENIPTYENRCVCHRGYFKKEDESCEKCHPDCRYCTGPEWYECTQCDGPDFLNGCYCAIEPFEHATSFICNKCQSSLCHSCDLQQTEKCLECESSFIMDTERQICIDCGDPKINQNDQNNWKELCWNKTIMSNFTINKNNRFLETSKRIEFDLGLVYTMDNSVPIFGRSTEFFFKDTGFFVDKVSESGIPIKGQRIKIPIVATSIIHGNPYSAQEDERNTRLVFDLDVTSRINHQLQSFLYIEYAFQHFKIFCDDSDERCEAS